MYVCMHSLKQTETYKRHKYVWLCLFWNKFFFIYEDSFTVGGYINKQIYRLGGGKGVRKRVKSWSDYKKTIV